jgi:hypothetical protein
MAVTFGSVYTAPGHTYWGNWYADPFFPHRAKYRRDGGTAFAD